MAPSLPSTTLPAAQPNYILRGHASSINALHFHSQNTRLLTGDADGFVVVWDLTVKRPLVVWRAHEGSILGLGTWGENRVVTHGRDSSLRVWRLTGEDERSGEFSKALPVDDGASLTTYRKQPWLLHRIAVSTLNFCAFASCAVAGGRPSSPAPHHKASHGEESSKPDASSGEDRSRHEQTGGPADAEKEDQLVLAVPSAQDTDIALYALPSQSQIALIPAPAASESDEGGRTGMVMALRVFCLPPSPSSDDGQGERGTRMESVKERGTLHVIAGYENGRTVVFRQVRASFSSSSPSPPSSSDRGRRGGWEQIATSRPHSQPILSLAPAPDLRCYYTSGADAIVARLPLLPLPIPLPQTQTQTQDSSSSPSSPSSSPPPPPSPSPPPSSTQPQNTTAAAAAAAAAATTTAETRAPKIVNTHHSGQQSLSVRSDGLILATAGWDGRARVYGAKSVRELAVLKWHRAGVYAVAFGEVGGRVEGGGKSGEGEVEGGDAGRRAGRLTVAEARRERTRKARWLAAGGKDGKVSLWDVY